MGSLLCHCNQGKSNCTNQDHVMIEYFKGPVTVAIDSNHWSFAHYEGGIYRPKTCSKVHLDHAVLAVGYGVDEDTGEEYYILKNSWGKDWGEAGYMRMARTYGNLCGIATQATFPIVSEEILVP